MFGKLQNKMATQQQIEPWYKRQMAPLIAFVIPLILISIVYFI